MSKFSGGEWAVIANLVTDSPIQIYVVDNEYKPVKYVAECRRVSDAKLIASAPEMYEILRKIIENTDKSGTGAPFGFVDLFSEARKLLARIDGEQEAQS